MPRTVNIVSLAGLGVAIIIVLLARPADAQSTNNVSPLWPIKVDDENSGSGIPFFHRWTEHEPPTSLESDFLTRDLIPTDTFRPWINGIVSARNSRFEPLHDIPSRHEPPLEVHPLPPLVEFASQEKLPDEQTSIIETSDNGDASTMLLPLEPIAIASPIPVIAGDEDSAVTLIGLVDFQEPVDGNPIENPIDGGIQQASFQEDATGEKPTDGKTNADDDSADGAVVSGTLETRNIAELQKLAGALVASVESNTELAEALKASRLQKLTQVKESLAKASEHKARTLDYQSQTAEFEKTEHDKRELLVTIVEPNEPVLDDSTNSDLLFRQLQARQLLLETNKKELQQQEQAIRTHADRVPRIPAERAAANDQMLKIESALKTLKENENEDPDHQLALLWQFSRRKSTEHKLNMLEAELKRQELAGRVLPIERDLVSREITRQETEVKTWNETATRFRNQEIARESALARQAAINADPALKNLAERNQELIRTRTEIGDKVKKITDELASVKSTVRKIKEDKLKLQEKIKAVGLTSKNGILLVEMKQNLQAPAESFMRIRQLDSDLQDVNLKVVSLTQERSELAEPIKVVEKLIGRSSADDPLVKMALEFVIAKRDYVDALKKDYEDYSAKISDLKVERQTMIEQTTATRDYILENALWIQSSLPIETGDLQKAKSGINSLVQKRKWTRMGLLVGNRMNNKPYEPAIAVFGLVGLAFFNRRLKLRLKRYETEPIVPSSGGEQ